MNKLKHIFAILWIVSTLGFLWTSTFHDTTLMWIFITLMWSFLITGYLVPNKSSNPNNHEVSTLTILKECIRQDTNKPDIMFLERGEKILK